jgi:hypothetical protein
MAQVSKLKANHTYLNLIDTTDGLISLETITTKMEKHRMLHLIAIKIPEVINIQLMMMMINIKDNLVHPSTTNKKIISIILILRIWKL